ncbi:MAG: CPBP family intramembrane glutamic endopeptidase, partial [Pseudomonadota bacterium]
GAFVAGATFVQLFTKVLIPLISGTETLIPYPAQGINTLPLWFKLGIAVSLFSIVPIAEEFLFRGVLYAGLAEAWNKSLAAVATTIMFIALHPANLGSGNALTHLALVLIAILLMWARVVTKSLYVPVMLHAGFNFSSVFLG